MNMKDHILAGLKEQFDQWEGLLASLDVDQLTTPIFDEGWSIKDVINHLWGWQQISLARMEAGVKDLAPEFPEWLTQFPDPTGMKTQIRPTPGFSRIFTTGHGRKRIGIGGKVFFGSWIKQNWSQKLTC